jgi:uncharacterized Fe-S cluster-containing MiaB family protein
VEPYLPENLTNMVSELMPTASITKPSFEVKVYKVGSYLDPSQAQLDAIYTSVKSKFSKEVMDMTVKKIAMQERLERG